MSTYLKFGAGAAVACCLALLDIGAYLVQLSLVGQVSLLSSRNHVELLLVLLVRLFLPRRRALITTIAEHPLRHLSSHLLVVEGGEVEHGGVRRRVVVQPRRLPEPDDEVLTVLDGAIRSAGQ